MPQPQALRLACIPSASRRFNARVSCRRAVGIIIETARHPQSVEFRCHALWHQEHLMLVVAIDRQVALAIKDDVVVDDDFSFCHDRGRSATVEGMWTTTLRDGIANALLRTWEYSARAATDSSGTTTSTGALIVAAPRDAQLSTESWCHLHYRRSRDLQGHRKRIARHRRVN